MGESEAVRTADIENDLMVGAEGFEPPTLCSQSRCATRLRYAPTDVPIVSRNRLN
jgi:hypothetical protein